LFLHQSANAEQVWATSLCLRNPLAEQVTWLSKPAWLSKPLGRASLPLACTCSVGLPTCWHQSGAMQRLRARCSPCLFMQLHQAACRAGTLVQCSPAGYTPCMVCHSGKVRVQSRCCVVSMQGRDASGEEPVRWLSQLSNPPILIAKAARLWTNHPHMPTLCRRSVEPVSLPACN
jgi:hypothetical protein